jgi:hypothetical protein
MFVEKQLRKLLLVKLKWLRLFLGRLRLLLGKEVVRMGIDGTGSK